MADPEFQAFAERFQAREVRTWSSIGERALLYGLARRTDGDGVIVELGSYCGGSAAVFAKGLKEGAGRGGRVHCVDPLLGAPPWLGLPSEFFTRDELLSNLRHLDVDDHVTLHTGDSASVGAVWPAQPIDVLLIDGDHSFEGALRDIETWVPKLRPGGVLVFDDVDHIEEMRRLDDVLGSVGALRRAGLIRGSSVFEMIGDGWSLLGNLKAVLATFEVHRPWAYDVVHQRRPPTAYGRTKLWREAGFALAYKMAFLATPANGDYGVSPNCAADLASVATSVQTDRGGGEVRVIGAADPPQQCRAVFCLPDEALAMSQHLQPGGLLIGWDPSIEASRHHPLHEQMRAGGLDGIGSSPAGLFWAVAGVPQLTPLMVMKGKLAALA